MTPGRLLPVGDTAWTVEFGSIIDPALHARVLGLAEAVARARSDARSGNAACFAAIVDIVPTFRSLTVHYDPLRCDGLRKTLTAPVSSTQRRMRLLGMSLQSR